MDNLIPTQHAERSLADLVRENSRVALIFERFGLDFCCGGRRTLREAAAAHGVAIDPIVAAIADVADLPAEDEVTPKYQDLSLLARHIVDHHHGYVRTVIPTISAWLDRLVERHGDRHPELESIRQTFGELADELMTHMVKEENMLFPYIERLAAAGNSGTAVPISPFGTVLNPIGVMEADHALAGELSARLRQLSGGYQPPPDACTTYRLCFEELQQFEHDLHQHIHLENNVLFPRAVDLEQRLGQ
jgi:regulator of cell morphogenesis and NO signaling